MDNKPERSRLVEKSRWAIFLALGYDNGCDGDGEWKATTTLLVYSFVDQGQGPVSIHKGNGLLDTAGEWR